MTPNTIFLLLGLFLLLVFVHELGHFIVAKLSGAKVEEFGFGFPPRIFGIRRGETLYSVNLLPIGGFVRIFGEEGEHKGNPRSFASRPIYLRALTIGAGVVMNVILAFLLFSAAHGIGVSTFLGDEDISQAKNTQVQIIEIVPNSPAELAGLETGDAILAVTRGEETILAKSAAEVQNAVEKFKGTEVSFKILRAGEEWNVLISPRVDPPAGEGAVGIAMTVTGVIAVPWYKAPIEGARTTYEALRALLSAFGGLATSLFQDGHLPEDVAGPVGIASFLGEMRDIGLVFIMQFAALLSLNLALINIIPFPALDGGRLLFIFIEWVKGSPVNRRFEKAAHATGFAILIFLMIAITVRDVGKFF